MLYTEIKHRVRIESVSPTYTTNPMSRTGSLWLNTTSGELFVCADGTQDRNIWLGQFGNKIYPRTIDVVDIFNDNSAIALYQMDGNFNDTGGNYNGVEYNATFSPGWWGQAFTGDGTDRYGVVSGFPIPSDYITLSFWFTHNGLGFLINYYYPILSFATSDSDAVFVYAHIKDTFTSVGLATSMSDYVLKLVPPGQQHITVIINTHDSTDFKVYGGSTEATGGDETSGTLASRPLVNTLMFGKAFPTQSSNYYRGKLDQVRIFNRALTESEIEQLNTEYE